MSFGFLHTARVHVATFDRLLDARAGVHAERVHVVDETLLADAMAQGIDAVAGRLATAIDGFPDDVDRILCTCSTLAGAAEQLGTQLGRPVVRIDRPLAARAVQAGSKIGVAYAVASTVAPTTSLLDEEAGHRAITISLIDCSSAWSAFLDGRMVDYHTSIAATVTAEADGLDVVVLCQASMAGAATHIDLGVPVLSSPHLAVETLTSAG